MKDPQRSKMPQIEQFSAGGAVFRETDSGTNVVIVKMIPELRWQLPKGIIDPGETPEQAASREVREEAGINTELRGPIRKIDYFFSVQRKGVRTRIHKFVQFYLMEYVSGDVADHDDEVEEARWVSVETALKKLAFEQERDVVRTGFEMYRKL